MTITVKDKHGKVVKLEDLGIHYNLKIIYTDLDHGVLETYFYLTHEELIILKHVVDKKIKEQSL